MPGSTTPSWLAQALSAKKPTATDTLLAGAPKSAAPSGSTPSWLSSAIATSPGDQRNKALGLPTGGGGHGGGIIGNLQGLGDIVRALPKGAGKFAAQAVHDLIVSPAYEIKRGVQHPFGGGEVQHAPTLPAQTAQSVARTGSDIAHPGRFVTAYQQGNLAGKVIEDLANASIIAGAAGNALTSGARGAIAEETAARAALDAAASEGAINPALIARLQPAEAAATAARATTPYRIGAVAKDISTLGTQGANLPAKPYEAVAAGVRKLGEVTGLGEKIAGTELAQRTADLATSIAGRHEARVRITRDIEHPKTVVQGTIMRAAPEAALKELSPIEQRAAVVVTDRVLEHPAVRAAIDNLDTTIGPEAANPVIERMFNDPGVRKGDAAHFIPADVIRTAKAYYEGGLAPKTADAISQVDSFYNQTVSPIVSRAQQQPGARLTGPLNPEQLGSTPMRSVVAEMTAPARAKLEVATTAAAQAGRRLAPAEERALSREITLEQRQQAAPERIAAQVPTEVQRAGLIARHGTAAAQARTQAEATLNEGIAKSQALQGQADLTRQTGLEQAAQGQAAIVAGEATRAKAAGMAEANQAAAPLPAQAAEIGRPGGITFRQALRHQTVGEGLVAKGEQTLAREESLRFQAQAAESKAADVAALKESGAIRHETQAAAIEAKPGAVKTTAEREVASTVRAAKEAGARLNDAARLSKDALKAERTRVKAAADLEQATAEANRHLDAVPARYRTVVATHRAAIAGLLDEASAMRGAGAEVAASALEKAAAEIPQTLDAIVAAGIDPAYLPGGLDFRGRGGKGVETNRRDYQLTKKRLPSEQARTTTIRPATPQGRLSLVSRELNQIIQNQAATKLMDEMGVSAHQLGIVTTRRQGAEIEAAANALGYTAFDPASFLPGSTPTAITADTKFVPLAVKREYGKYVAPTGPLERAAQAYVDPITRTWKDATLPLSGSWHVGNIISNVLMNTIGTGSLAWVTKIPEAWRNLKQERATGASDLPGELYGRDAQRAWNDFISSKTGKPPSVIRRILNKSYRLNGFVDDLSRSTVYLAEYDRAVAQGLVSDAAREQAINAGIKVSGRFAEMTRFEQQVARRVIPFYAWSRHVTQLVSDLAVHHPARLVWAMQLSQMFGDPTDKLFPDAVGTQGGIWSFGNLNPFGQFADLYFNEQGPLAGVGQSLNPILKTALAATAGINTSRDFAPLRLPPGSGALDQFGNPVPTALITQPANLARFALRTTPLARTAYDLARGQRLAEYDTGQPVLRRGQTISSTPSILGTDISGRLGILARQAGVPTVTPFDIAGAEATAAKRQAAAATAKRKYEKQLHKARG